MSREDEGEQFVEEEDEDDDESPPTHQLAAERSDIPQRVAF